MGRYNRFLSLKVNVLWIQSFLVSGHAMLLEHQEVSGTLFMENSMKVARKVKNTDQTI